MNIPDIELFLGESGWSDPITSSILPTNEHKANRHSRFAGS